jgi:hypothetical protein
MIRLVSILLLFGVAACGAQLPATTGEYPVAREAAAGEE